MANNENPNINLELVERYVKLYRKGEINGNNLSELESSGEITKSERRKIIKLSLKEEKDNKKELSERQKLRLIVKEKKSRPKLTKDERKKKFQSAALDQEREDNKSKSIVCLGCRKRGHLLKNCPEAKKEVGICFNCGSSGHALRACSKPRGSTLKYAKCFVCGGTGHISRECPENANGLYPSGGCCHICLQKTHLVKDCPERTEEDAAKYQKRKLEEEDNELGPRIGEMTTQAGGRGGNDELISFDFDNDRNVGENDELLEEDDETREIESNKPKKKKRRSSKK